MKRWGNEEYESIADVKRFDFDEYEKIIEQFKEKINWIRTNVKLNNSNVVAYRMLSIKDPTHFISYLKTESNVNLGIYWSFEKLKVRTYWGSKSQSSVLLNALIPLDSIDYVSTLKANTSFALSNGENEITVLKDKPINLISVEFLDKKITINKTLRA